LPSAIERFVVAFDSLRVAQERAAALWADIDTPADASMTAKRVSWAVVDEMSYRMHALKVAVQAAEFAAVEVQRGRP